MGINGELLCELLCQKKVTKCGKNLHIVTKSSNFATNFYAVMKTIVGSNLKKFRTASGYTAQVVADFLGITRSAYANYEAGSREMPLAYLEKIADLFGCELHALFSETPDDEDVLLCAFRADDLSASDAKVVADFKSVVKSYLKMQRIK